MPEFLPLYRWSAAEAKRLDEMEKWRASQTENILCRDFMDEQIQLHYEGSHLNSRAANDIVDEFGFDRTMWLLANHIQLEDWDVRFSAVNREWAKGIYIQRPAEWELKKDPYLTDRNRDLLLKSHPVKIDSLADKVRQMYAGLNLYDHRHRVEGDVHQQDFTGKVLLLRDDMLRESCRTPENQLFLASYGNGCRPGAKGRAVFGEFLIDGEKTRFERQDFVGVCDDRFLPGWAQEKLTELQPKQSPEEAPDENTGQTMKGM